MRRALDSIDAQTDRDFELLIVNDASSDGDTLSLCRELEASGRARVVWNPSNVGCGLTRDAGFRAMRGDICIPLDADDTLPADAVANVRRAWREHPDADFVFGDYLCHDAGASRPRHVDCSRLADANGWLDPERLAGRWRLLGSSPCHRRAWERAGGYDPQFSRTVPDVDFFMRVLLRGGRGRYANAVLYTWHRAPGGMSSNVALDDKLALRRRHIAFYDRYGDGNAVRAAILRSQIGRERYTDARAAARAMGLRSLTSTGGLAAYMLPPRAIAFMHSMVRRLRRRSTDGAPLRIPR